MPTELQSQTSFFPRGLIHTTGIGGSLAIGLGMLLYYCFPAYVALVDRHLFVIVCTAIGTGLYQAITQIWRLVFADTIDKKLQKLDRLHEEKRISDDTYKNLVKKLCEKEFLE